MLDELCAYDAAQRLERAARDPALSASAQARARELADRLARGVRILVMGPDGVGKSALCDALLKRRDWTAPGNGTRIFGAAETATLPEILIGTLFPEGPEAHGLGLGQLIDLSRGKEIVQSTDRLDLADIVLWCTQGFTAEEAETWAQAPDDLKDHSFLVLTKADVLAKQGHLEQHIARLQQVVREEFHSFYPVAIAGLRRLQTEGHPVTEAQFSASGLKALSDALAGMVRSGLRADLDSAMLFLERQGLTLDAPLSLAPFKTEEPEQPRPPERPRHDPLPFKRARDGIMERAFDLAELGFDEAEGDMSQVLDLCGTIAEDLAQEMRGQAKASPDFAPWRDAFEDASDKIMLMTMENDTRSAADAVTILLQLRRDLDQLTIQ